MELYKKTLLELIREIGNKKITVEEVVNSHILRCKKVDGSLKAFEEYDYEYILNEMNILMKYIIF